MQDQGKRLILAAVIAIGIIFAWQAVFPPAKTPPKATATGSGSGSGSGGAGPTLALPGASGNFVADAAAAPEQVIELGFAKFVAKFTNHGGAIKSWHLHDPRYARDPSHGEFIPQFAQGNANAAALQVNFINSTYALPRNAVWTGEKVGDTQVVYRYQSPELEIKKTFTLYPHTYLVKLAVEVKVLATGEAKQTLAVSSFGYQNPKDKGGGGQSVKARVWQSASMRGESMYETSAATIAKAPRMETGFAWTGFAHPYMLNVVAPKRGADEKLEKRTYSAMLGSVAGPEGLMRTDIWFPTVAMSSSGGPLTREVIAYIGPNHYDLLKQADEVAGFATGLDKTVDFGWFKFIGRPLQQLLKGIYGIVGNWGIAIILLTVLVKLATLYWTLKQTRSSNIMRALTPKIKELQEKYKDDKQRQFQEQQALFKQHEYNQFAGCLPMLLQMPIWIALYRMLSSAGELYLQPFAWINDLTNVDPYYIIPLVLMATMFVQSKMMPAVGDNQQQKMMMIMMPLMFGVMGFFFPSGLGLYILTNTALSILITWWVNHYDPVNKRAVAKVEAAMKVGGAATVINDDKPQLITDVLDTPNGVKKVNKSNKRR